MGRAHQDGADRAYDLIVVFVSDLPESQFFLPYEIYTSYLLPAD
ncbi:MAG: hypothetical protein ACOCYX_02925 [Spirochaetota bacterium]